jgi:nucleotide-binding universal stress UspA family protein
MNTNRLFNPLSSNVLASPKANSMLRVSNGGESATRLSLLDNSRTFGNRIRDIVVPLDGSTFAEHAIPLALGIAEQCGSALQLVHAEVPVDLSDTDSALTALKREKKRYLADIVQQLSAKTSAFVSSRTIDGRAVSQTLKEADKINADLIVMATHGRGAIGRFWWGSFAHSLLQQVSIPVILIHGRNAPAVFKPKSVNHVLLPLDGEKTSEKVIDPLLDFNVFPTARHTLLQVVRLEPKYVLSDYALRTEWVPSRRRWIAGMQYLHPLATSLRDHGRRVHTKVLSCDEPVGEVILRCAEQADVDLITIGYRRRSRLSRLLRPSVSEYLFRTSTCPLMFVPAEDRP